MTEYSDTAIIVWPAVLPEVDVAHTTVMYLGKIPDITVPKEKILEVLRSIPLSIKEETPISVTGTDIFGKEEKYVVATLDPTILEIDQKFIKAALQIWADVHDAGNFPDYRPHTTLGPEGNAAIETPDSIVLKPLELWWGDEQIVI